MTQHAKLSAKEFSEMRAKFAAISNKLNGKSETRTFLKHADAKFDVDNILEYHKNLCVVVLENEVPVIYAYSGFTNIFYRVYALHPVSSSFTGSHA